MITVIGNLKGGSGKSTVTFNLALWLVYHDANAVAFDLDPQATLSDVAEVRREEGFEPPITVYRAENDPAAILRRHGGEVLVDVGASNLWAMRQAINMADRILVPVTPSQADIWSTQRFLNIIVEALRSDRRPEILTFLNRADTHISVRESNEAEEALSSLPGVTALRTRLAQRMMFRRSFSEGLAVFELEPSGKAAWEFNRLASVLYPHFVKQPAARRGQRRPQREQVPEH
ncbi:MAG: AAA family ATPase [Gammaproteobacteria bacterium]|nr:AAA family ATPase [Gammaproteobacteria bacterium]